MYLHLTNINIDKNQTHVMTFSVEQDPDIAVMNSAAGANQFI